MSGHVLNKSSEVLEKDFWTSTIYYEACWIKKPSTKEAPSVKAPQEPATAIIRKRHCKLSATLT